MTTFALDNNNNLIFKSNITLKTGLEALTQDVKTMLGMWKGEDIYNIESGVDYEKIIKSNSINTIKNIIKSELKKDDRINKIEFLQFENIDSKLNIMLQLSTNEGVAIV